MVTKSKLMNLGVKSEVAVLLGTNTSIVTTEREARNALARGDNLIVFDPITLTANLTVTTTLCVYQGGVITTAGFTLTIGGPFEAGAYQVFNASSGSVVFSSGKACTEILAEWWGATGDGATDDTTAWQAAINAARINPQISAGNIPIRALVERTYMINSLYIPAFTVIQGPEIRQSSAVFKCNTTSAVMFIVDGGDRYSDFIAIKGLRFDPNGKATTCISIESGGNLRVSDCNFHNDESLTAVTNHVLLKDGAVWCWFERCTFNGKYTYGAHLTGHSNQNVFRECHFSGNNCTHAVFGDSSWNGDTLLLDDCAIETGGCTNIVYLDNENNGSSPSAAGGRASIINCRFDRSCTNAQIYVARFCWGVLVQNCRMVDSCAFNVYSDARDTIIRDCFLGNATTACIKLDTNSYRCRVYSNVIGHAGGGTYIIDSGGTYENWIFRKVGKDITANRPTLQPSEFGALNLDTTLDADGKPIWWNGTAWVDATGAVV